MIVQFDSLIKTQLSSSSKTFLAILCNVSTSIRIEQNAPSTDGQQAL